MKHRTAFAVAAAALITFCVTGCYQSPDVTWYEAGHYKGARDPLLEKLNSKDFQERLASRVSEIQTDR